MKRTIKWFKGLDKNIKIGFAIAFVLALVMSFSVAICYFVTIDKEPATNLDYEHFENQVMAISQNHDLLFKTDSNISVKDEVITVYFESEECNLTAQYDSNFELLSIQKKDNSTNWWLVLSESLLLWILSIWSFFWIWIFIIGLLELFVDWIKSKKKTKNKPC